MIRKATLEDVVCLHALLDCSEERSILSGSTLFVDLPAKINIYRPRRRPYETDNTYAALEREMRLRKEVKALEEQAKKARR